MTDILRGLAVGAVLGLFFYGGLWWTVQCIMTRSSAAWVAMSLPLRAAVTAGGLYLAARDQWQEWAICLAGFAAARFAVAWFTRVTQ